MHIYSLWLKFQIMCDQSTGIRNRILVLLHGATVLDIDSGHFLYIMYNTWKIVHYLTSLLLYVVVMQHSAFKVEQA